MRFSRLYTILNKYTIIHFPDKSGIFLHNNDLIQKMPLTVMTNFLCLFLYSQSNKLYVF